jgi:mono/diheme cytochrome c family protein
MKSVAVVMLMLLAAGLCRASQADTPSIFAATSIATTDGQKIYEQICQGCHMPTALGATGAGRYPALAKDPALASRQFMALTLLHGRRNMPAFGTRHAIGFIGPPLRLTDEQIAAVTNYVRSHFGNNYKDRITATEVTQLDRDTP